MLQFVLKFDLIMPLSQPKVDVAISLFNLTFLAIGRTCYLCSLFDAYFAHAIVINVESCLMFKYVPYFSTVL